MRPSNQFLIHQTVHPSNPYLSNLERRMLWGTVHKKLGGGTARTAGPSWPKGYSIPYGVMLSIETGGSWLGAAIAARELSGHRLGPSTREVWEERSPVKTEAKKLLSTSAFSSSVVTSLPVLFIGGKPFLLFLASFVKFSSSHALAFLTPSLHNWAASLYSSQDTCPCSHCLCISFLPFSLTKLEFSVPEIQGPNFTLHLTNIPQDCELHQCMIAAGQTASNLDVTD
ncbi:hypothetical protein QYF61_002161 [Mycteria americana]|uniref:Uncharacterized protein n=1 Tax=Mycteria americana TaxID=33587 RepID=A0AAN7NKG2_MYCAM|nr:hypothetical protein QYF61_002161 [Mycteria americana]